MVPFSLLAMTTEMKNIKLFVKWVVFSFHVVKSLLNSFEYYILFDLIIFMLWWVGTGFSDKNLKELFATLRSKVILKPKVPSSYILLWTFATPAQYVVMLLEMFLDFRQSIDIMQKKPNLMSGLKTVR
jgi:hypothetical protein